LLEHRSGAGRLVLCTYPLEHMAAQTSAVNPEPTWRLYAALAEVAGVSPDVHVADPGVVVGELVHDDGRRFVWFINLLEKPVRCTPRVRPGSLKHLETGAPVTQVELGAFGVQVLERSGGALGH
jgi:hypothetical protein